MSDRGMALFVSILNAVMDDSLSESDTSDGGERDLSRYDINQGNLRRRALRDDIDSETDDSENQPPLSPRATVRSMMSIEGEECKISVDKNPHHKANIDGNDEGEDDGIERPVQSLLDLAAQAVAKTSTCEILEFANPPLDEALLRKIAFWSFPTDEAKIKAYANMTDHIRAWVRGQGLVKEGKVKEMWQVGFMATAYLAKYSKEENSACSDIRVSLTFEQQRILSSTCSECKSDTWCTHVVAAVIYRMQNPDKVIVHAPMTETLSTLDRHQLQKLLQYAVQEDPAGILGKVFKHIDAVRDNTSEMNQTEGAPDPTFGGLPLEKSHWELSVELMERTLAKSLSNLTAGPTFTWIESSSNRNKYYPDCFDQVKKQHAHMNWFNSRVVDLVRNGENMQAAEVLIVLMKNVIMKLKEVSDLSSRNLKRYFHDLSRFYAMCMMFVQDKDLKAWNTLKEAAIEMSSTPGLLLYSLKTSLWAELPSLASCIRGVNLEETEALYEPVAASRLNPPPHNFYEFLDGDVPIEEHPYIEHIPVMFARLQAFNFFGKTHKNYTTRMTRLGLKLLVQLSKLASRHSIIGEYLARSTSLAREPEQDSMEFLLDRSVGRDSDIINVGVAPHFSKSCTDLLSSVSNLKGMPDFDRVAASCDSDPPVDTSQSSPQPGPSSIHRGGPSSRTSSRTNSRSSSPVFPRRSKLGSEISDTALPGPSGVQNLVNILQSSRDSKDSSSTESRSSSPVFNTNPQVCLVKTDIDRLTGLHVNSSGTKSCDMRTYTAMTKGSPCRRKSLRTSTKSLSNSAKKARMSPGKSKSIRLTRQTRSLGSSDLSSQAAIKMASGDVKDGASVTSGAKQVPNKDVEIAQNKVQCPDSQMLLQGDSASWTTASSFVLDSHKPGPSGECLPSVSTFVTNISPLLHEGTKDQALESGDIKEESKRKSRKRKLAVGSYLRSPIRTRAKKRAASGPLDVPEAKRQRQYSAPAYTSKGKGSSSNGGKGQKGKGPSKGKLPVQRRRLLEEDDTFPHMNGGQLAYCLMYSVHVVMKYEKKTGHKLCPEQLLLSYVLLALEMGYFRTVASKDSTQLTEHDWLWRLEQSMSEYMQRKFSAKSKAVHGYLQAFKKVGLQFYEGSFPLVLLDNLSSMISLNGEQRQSWGKHLVVILAELLAVVPQSLDKYTLPTTSKYAYFIDSTSYRKNVHKDFVMYRIHNIASTLLSMIQTDNKQHEELLVKILLNMRDVDMVVLLNLLIKDFKLQLYKLKNNRPIMEALLQFSIKAYRHTRSVQLPGDSVLKDQTFLFSLADNLGLSSLKFFLKDWKTLFNVKDVKGLIYLFEPQIRAMESPPEEVVELILQVLKESYACGMEACDLLSFFMVGDSNYKLALTKIQENKGSYETSTLFAIAQQHWERKKGRNVRNLDPETMKILEAAMEQIQFRGSPLFDQLDWLFKVCTTGPVKEIHKSPQFQKMITLITKHAASTPDVLLRILQNVEKTPTLLKHVESISQALVGSYLEYFSNKLFSCSHSAYNSVINEMLRAKLDCKHYLKDGEAQFDERVVSSIRSLHRNRKKFIRMLDGEFPSTGHGVDTK